MKILFSLIMLFIVRLSLAETVIVPSKEVDLATFSFNDFLALILALFSVALSVAFYFKAIIVSCKW